MLQDRRHELAKALAAKYEQRAQECVKKIKEITLSQEYSNNAKLRLLQEIQLGLLSSEWFSKYCNAQVLVYHLERARGIITGQFGEY